MAQIAKVEATAEIKCAASKMYDLWKCNKSQFVNLFPQIFKSVQSIEGEEGQPGNVFIFEYVLGKSMRVKVKTEEINDEERRIRFRAVEGEIMQLYSSFVIELTVKEGSVELFIEFEKKSELAPNPDIYVKLAVEVTKGIDLYILTH